MSDPTKASPGARSQPRDLAEHRTGRLPGSTLRRLAQRILLTDHAYHSAEKFFRELAKSHR